MERIISFLFFFTIYLSTPTFAIDEFSFKQLGIKDGLSHSQINYITKDSQGFMWFSTASGLNRYDGYGFKVFKRNGTGTALLTDNYVEKVQEDADGNLWVCFARSVYFIYDAQKEAFYPASSILKEKYGIAASPTYLYIDKRKNIWCYVETEGVYQYQISSRKLLFYSVNKGNSSQGRKLCNMAEDEESVLLIYDDGLIESVDKDSARVLRRMDYLCRNPKNKYSKFYIFVDSDGDYWIYTKDISGMWTYCSKEKRWEFLNSDKTSPYILSNDIVNDVKQDNDGLIWIATDHGGINLIDKKLHLINYLVHDKYNERSVAQNSINCLYCDDSGIVWIGTYKRGISYYNESIFKFRTNHLSSFNNIKGFDADVNAIAEDKQGNLWLGTNGSGIAYLSRNMQEHRIYQHSTEKNSLSGDVIVSMIVSRNGTLWAGTYQNGLNSFDGTRFTSYYHQPNHPNSLANNNVWALAEDDNGILWIGTLGSGLQSLNTVTGKFTTYAPRGSEYASDCILSICIGRDKNLYMATNTGITVFNPFLRKFEKWKGNKRNTQFFSHYSINQVYEDSRGLLWVATPEGINIYDRKKDEIIVLNKDKGFRNEIIHSIVEDNNKNMWVTTTAGMSNIVVNTDPKTGVYNFVSYVYNEQDGLQKQEFNPQALIKTFHGEIIAGGMQGINMFDPENVRYNRIVPTVVFTDVQLFNQQVKIDSIYDHNCILTQAINKTSKVTFEHKQNVFSISFSSMNYILPEKTTYMYMLEGFSKNWLAADGNKVTYTNLAPGEYTLKVKAVNSDGFSNNEASTLKIVIRPPFWASPLAYVFYFLIIVGLLLLARSQLLRVERNKYKLAQIEQEAQRKHEIDDMKLRFFTNISHELRTPLTLILSPLENLIKSIGDDESKQTLKLMHRNAIRLLNIVNQLLDFRKSDVKGHQLNLAQGDIIEFVHTISTSFAEYSEKKNVHLTFFSSIPELYLVFDEDKIGKIVMNLLSNAFKFTPPNGRVDLFLTLLTGHEDEQDVLEMKISDTGIGVKDKDKERIFERFYQVQQKDNHKFSGSGVGLHLVKEFVTLHGGSVTVHDNIGQGSVFIVRIPAVYVQKEPEIVEAQVSDVEQIAQEEADMSLSELWSNGDNGKPVILVVDDSDDFRLFIKDCLKPYYQIIEASDGAEALSAILELQPDVVICDVMMPEMDGFEVCRRIKTDINTSHIPFILLTARSAEEQKLKGLETGADDYITKPFNFDILLLRIEKLIQLQKQRQENFQGKVEVNPSEIAVTSLDEKLLQKAIQYVEDHINRSELSVEELSRELGMSRVHLYKKLLVITGKTPIEFIRVIRLKRAAQLLRQSQQNISEIAYQVGFNSPKYFSKYFKEEFGVLPSVYQEKESK